jgi:hypothetical protein
MEREIGINSGQRTPQREGSKTAGGGWLVNIVLVWKDIDMEDFCPKAAAGRNHVCRAHALTNS